jgi:hypothetical protein
LASSAPERGCGRRSPGGAYLVTALGERGDPIETFVVDPPRVIDPTKMGLSAQGMALVVQNGKPPGVLDWVGAEAYPNAADYVEETALFGSSRRIPTSFDFGFLQPGSRHLLIHPRAAVTPESAAGFALLDPLPGPPAPSVLDRALRRQGALSCPFQPKHEDPGGPLGEVCAAWWWEWLLPKTVQFASDEAAMERQSARWQAVPRAMPSFTYSGYALPDPDVWTPRWAPAIFLALPIHRVEVVRDPGDLRHEITLSRARKAGIPVVEVDE